MRNEAPSHPRIALALLGTLLLLVPLPVQSSGVGPPPRVAPPRIAPSDFRWEPLDRSSLPTLRPQDAVMKAVAIVGDLGDDTYLNKNDMDRAVTALESYGVTVHKFYYGWDTFTWADIVAAAADAHFLLYMGHGVMWGGTCQNPTLVGGFHLSSDEKVHPDQIRSDLAGWMADDSIVILSHVCWSAGVTSCDGAGEPSQAEAQRRVRMYAAPFVDIGVEAYYANNYDLTAEDIVDGVLSDSPSRKNVGDVFKSVYPYDPSEFHDLAYPDVPGYDLWLCHDTYGWNDAFVGIPGYVFSGDIVPPELGPLPASLAFTYNTATAQLSPADEAFTPANVGSDAALTWDVSTQGDWFTASPTHGTTPPDQITITPVMPAIVGLPVGRHEGWLTLTVTDPPGTLNGVQQVDLELDVVVPQLGGLPSELRFTHYLSTAQTDPSSYQVTPQNVGSADELNWDLTHDGAWFTVSPQTGDTTVAFTVAPDEVSATEPTTYTGVITLTVTSPEMTVDAVQTIPTSLNIIPGGPGRAYLPFVARH